MSALFIRKRQALSPCNKEAFMPEADDLKVQDCKTTEEAPATKAQFYRAARRRFFRQAFAGTFGVRLAEVLSFFPFGGAPPKNSNFPSAGSGFSPLGVIT